MDDPLLPSLVHKHRLFFDKLVELIPAKFYISKEDQETLRIHGMNKAQRAAAKQATKKNLKKAKRNRLDPDKFASTLEIIQQRDTQKADDTGDDDVTLNNDKLHGKESRVSSYEELRERLQKRIEALREKRNADAAKETAIKAWMWKNERKNNTQDLKRKAVLLSEPDLEKDLENHGGKQIKKSLPNSENGESEAGEDFEFGRVKMGVQNHMKINKRKHNESKEKKLAVAMKLQSEMKDPEKGQDLSLKHSWTAALSRASGEKVYDDPNRIKQSIKREKHQRQKSMKKWEERRETVKQSIETKQQTRQENIKERKRQKKEKKIAKREKKLLRPGFEGRRGGFINE